MRSFAATFTLLLLLMLSGCATRSEPISIRLAPQGPTPDAVARVSRQAASTGPSAVAWNGFAKRNDVDWTLHAATVDHAIWNVNDEAYPDTWVVTVPLDTAIRDSRIRRDVLHTRIADDHPVNGDLLRMLLTDGVHALHHHRDEIERAVREYSAAIDVQLTTVTEPETHEGAMVAADFIAARGTPRGNIVFLNGLAETLPEGRLARTLARRGYNVIHVFAPVFWQEDDAPSLVPPEEDVAADARIDGVLVPESTIAPAPVTEPMSATLGESDWMETDFGPFAGALFIDLHLNSSAFAAESIAAMLIDEGRIDPDLPWVVVSFSYGGLVTPLLVNRHPGLFSAAVLGVTGVRPWRQPACQKLFGDRPLEGEHIDCMMAYLATSAPENHAHALMPIPTLILDGAMDAWFTRSSTNALHRRAGRPERWTYPVGHIGFMATLDLIAPGVMDWIGGTLRRSRSESESAEAEVHSES